MRIMQRHLQRHLMTVLAVGSWGLFASVAVAQDTAPSPSRSAPSDDDMTMVVATRIVTLTDPGTSLKVMFDTKRVPDSTLNATDRCVEDHALEIAQDYFNTLGRLLGRAAFYYEVPDEEIGRRVQICEKMHTTPPQAWGAGKTKIIALGSVLPSAAAAEFEKSLR